jgi:hypothetical protein
MVPRRAAIDVQEIHQTVSELPYIDEHAIWIVASREVAWRALEQYITAFLRSTEDGLLTRLLGPCRAPASRSPSVCRRSASPSSAATASRATNSPST